MRLILTILLFISFSAKATNYYFAAAGSNGNAGTIGSPFQTLAKLASVTLIPGDSVLLKRGETFAGGFTVNQSGSAGLPIVFSSYGVGVKPVISGLQNLTGWTNTTGNIWEATAINSVPYQKTIIINGAITAKGRYPNATNIALSESGNTTARIVTTLTGTPDYTGAEAVVNVYGYIHDVVKIVSQSVDTLKFYDDFNDFPPNTRLTYGESSRWFFIQNSPLVLDLQNEWCYDSLTKKVSIYSATGPTNVQYSAIDTLVYLQNKNYITLNGLNFTGGNYHSIRTDTADHISIINCVINNNGGDGIIAKESDYLTLQNDTVTNNLNDGISAVRNCNYANISSNYIKNSGMFDGMGGNANGTYMGVFVQGLSCTVSNNRIDSSGYVAIRPLGTNALIEYNWITESVLVKEDGGAIHTDGDGYSAAGTIIRNNIITNSTNRSGNLVAGIYFDGNTNDLLCDSNTVFNFPYGIFYHYPQRTILRGNTFVGGIGIPFYHAIGGAPYGNTMRNNIYYSTDSLIPAWRNYYASLYSGSTSDSNFFLRPLKEGKKISITENSTSYDLDEWFTASGYEEHSHSTPAGIISPVGTLYYNPTLSDIIISLPGNYVSATGTLHSRFIVLKPFQSIVLFLVSNFEYSGRIGNLNFQ